MKTIIETVSTTTNDLESASFGISQNQEDINMLLDGLRSGIYTDKVGAVLREYGANAWDANRSVGKGDEPIVVHVPTNNDPVLRIRDNGPGLSKEDVITIYTQYGASTKRNTNGQVGSFGLGGKSGFAYADTFTVVSFYGGYRRTYQCVLDDNGGRMSLLDESPSDEPTGVEIQIAVKRNDVYDFTEKARKLYQHYTPRPKINIDLPALPTERTVLKNGTITDKGGWDSKWFAIMGCVPYRLNLEQLDQTQINECLSKLSGSINFEIGDVKVAFSREELQYTEKTKAAVVQKLNDLVDEYVVHALKELETPGVSSWDKRLKVQVLKEMGLPLPEEYEELGKSYIVMKLDPATCSFTIIRNDSSVTNINISKDTRFLLKDTTHPCSHYPHLKQYDYVVKSLKDVTALRAELEVALKAAGLDGVPVTLLSAEHYQAPFKKAPKVVNPKHKAAMFTYRTDKMVKPNWSTLSDNWDAVDRVPEDTDIWVVLERFEAHSAEYKNFYNVIQSVAELAKALGETVPIVHGYKSTEKKPVNKTDLKGQEFWKWFTAWKTEMQTKHAKRLQDYWWTFPNHYENMSYGRSQAKLITGLGDEHPLVTFFTRKVDQADQCLKELVPDWKTSDCFAAIEKLDAMYPLLAGNRSVLFGNQRPHWIEYVQLIDARNSKALDTQTENG